MRVREDVAGVGRCKKGRQVHFLLGEDCVIV